MTTTSPTSPASSPPPLNTALLTISDEAAAELAPIWQLDAKNITAALFDVVPPLLDKWGVASASAAADWYDELRATAEVPGRFTAIIKPPGDLGANALAGWGSVPLTQTIYPSEADAVSAARSRVEGGLQKRIANSANLTITDSANRDPQARGWMRKTRPEACKFCIMVASRGGVFTKATSTFACHEKCYCTAIPAWGGKELPVGPYKPSDKPSNAADRARVRKWIADNL